MKVLELIDMCKFAKGLRIFENVSMVIGEGQCYGIVGKDDAGKTSLVEAMLGLSRYDSGEVRFCEKQIGKDDFSVIGYVPDDLLGFERITGVKLIDMLLEMKRIHVDLDYVQDLIDFFGIDVCQNIEYMDEDTNKCLYIISVLMFKPKLLILDEPFNFLSKEYSQKLYKFISMYKESGNAVIILSDNYMDIKEVADYFTYLYEGKQLLKDECVEKYQERIVVTVKGFDKEEVKKMLVLWLKMEPRDDAFLKSICVLECEDGTLKFVLKNDVTYVKRFIMSIKCDEFEVSKLGFEDMIIKDEYKNMESILEEILK